MCTILIVSITSIELTSYLHHSMMFNTSHFQSGQLKCRELMWSICICFKLMRACCNVDKLISQLKSIEWRDLLIKWKFTGTKMHSVSLRLLIWVDFFFSRHTFELSNDLNERERKRERRNKSEQRGWLRHIQLWLNGKLKIYNHLCQCLTEMNTSIEIDRDDSTMSSLSLVTRRFSCALKFHMSLLLYIYRHFSHTFAP